MAPKKIRNNVVDHRLKDGADFVEDVTSVEPPQMSFTTSELSGAGLGGKINMPDRNQLEAMSFKVNHNNGRNCEKLARPGKHQIEVRLARQDMDTAAGEMGLVSDKYRLTGLLTSTQDGNVEKGNPQSGSCEYSLLRMEHERGGVIINLVDILTNQLVVDGVDFSSELKTLLDD